MLFAILFGLSMDYEVFLVMRIHEEWLRSGNNAESVRKGLAARTTITAAARSCVVFDRSSSAGSGSSRSSDSDWPQRSGGRHRYPVGIVPSLMLLFDKANWWFPAWLERIVPHIHVEPEDLPE